MESFENFVCIHPYFNMLVFICIGFLLRGIRRINFKAIQFHIEELELALEEKDIEKAKSILQKFKSGFGLKD